MDKQKLSIKPIGGIKTGNFKPNKYVKVDTTAGYYGIKGKYNLSDKTSISGSVTKDFTKADVSYPAGSLKYKSNTKPYYEIKIEKKFGSGGKQKDLSKFVDEKNKGGSIAIGCGKVMKDRRKKTKRS